mmetsp:Transcript_61897/g.147418  ORF Transcript_61897/g.147418 Transcript_61897/m.147418 type:complete len:328 (+) Transcript_61897:745-1728(+)
MPGRGFSEDGALVHGAAAGCLRLAGLERPQVGHRGAGSGDQPDGCRDPDGAQEGDQHHPRDCQVRQDEARARTRGPGDPAVEDQGWRSQHPCSPLHIRLEGRAHPRGGGGGAGSRRGRRRGEPGAWGVGAGGFRGRRDAHADAAAGKSERQRFPRREPPGGAYHRGALHLQAREQPGGKREAARAERRSRGAGPGDGVRAVARAVGPAALTLRPHDRAADQPHPDGPGLRRLGQGAAGDGGAEGLRHRAETPAYGQPAAHAVAPADAGARRSLVRRARDALALRGQGAQCPPGTLPGRLLKRCETMRRGEMMRSGEAAWSGLPTNAH